MARPASVICVALALLGGLWAEVPDKDFTGTWLLDRAASNFHQLAAPDDTLVIRQDEAGIDCLAGRAKWVIPLDGNERKYPVGGETWNSAAKWEGAALLINTLATGSRDYTIMDRWRLSRDLQTLTITRQVLQGGAQSEGMLIYRKPGARLPEPAPAHAATPPAASARVLVRRPEPAAAPAPVEREYVVPAGTHVLLSLVNSVNTKHSREGDRVYLETAFPVTADGRVVIPRGSSVTGTVSNSTRPGKVKGKGELYIRFDQLTLPNGVTRDFRSRLGSADNGSDVDRKEGAVRGSGNHGGDARTVATGAGIGATLGGAIGRSVGTAGMGGAAGAAAGLATVLMKRGPDPTLPRGTQVEMVLDRDLRYRADELGRR